MLAAAAGGGRILSGEIAAGQAVRIDVRDRQLTFEPGAAEPAQTASVQ